MAPGLIFSSLPRDELWECHGNVPHDGRMSTSSTTASSNQASPSLHAIDVDTRGAKGNLPPGTDTQAAQSADMTKLLESQQELNQIIAISTEKKRRLDELLKTWPGNTPPLIRAYSEGTLPAPTIADSDTDTSSDRANPMREARYQATVEDCTESEDDQDTPTPSCVTLAPTPQRDSRPDHTRPRLQHTIAASAPTSPTKHHVEAAKASTHVAVPIVKEVRFSDRVPTVLQRSASARHTSWTDGTSQREKSYAPRERILSIQDERWGTLFTPQGKATVRMRNVLRGLAIHVIEVYKPNYSLVVTPEKLYKFYSKYGLNREAVDFERVFSLSSPRAMSRLEKLYLSLQCDFHLVQASSPGPKKWPCIPALTPEGFVQWNVMLIRAFPDQEAARLARIFADIALEAAPEDPSVECSSSSSSSSARLPRQISRHLLPAEANLDEVHLVTSAIRDWRHATSPDSRPSAPARAGTGSGGQNPPPLIHSDSRSRQEHLHRCRRDYENEAVEIVVPHGSSSSSSSSSKRGDEREGRSSTRYVKSHNARPESPRRGSKRYVVRRDGKELERERERERERRRGDRRWSDDGQEESRYRRREGRASRA
ncbi:hydroxyproline-rich glycoprotein DZ-HRGP [Beauveria brongniartii RCEF 3172]|uniref:Hydroxyproline-rich glycoprotein DZ-HRGP n=1 Tax=Beauveria brongniartii RCEF 3172 TaxID=1081107 RepID=A0A167H1T0_9HYPO|nr:hydroxyproline-rich glycoprotein DZ-HRGP [Beauveria brongniartii RCEF 3172]